MAARLQKKMADISFTSFSPRHIEDTHKCAPTFAYITGARHTQDINIIILVAARRTSLAKMPAFLPPDISRYDIYRKKGRYYHYYSDDAGLHQKYVLRLTLRLSAAKACVRFSHLRFSHIYQRNRDVRMPAHARFCHASSLAVGRHASLTSCIMVPIKDAFGGAIISHSTTRTPSALFFATRFFMRIVIMPGHDDGLTGSPIERRRSAKAVRRKAPRLATRFFSKTLMEVADFTGRSYRLQIEPKSAAAYIIRL